MDRDYSDVPILSRGRLHDRLASHSSRSSGTVGSSIVDNRGDRRAPRRTDHLRRAKPKQPICGEELKTTFALPPQDAHLTPKGDELKFQGGTTSNTEERRYGADPKSLFFFADSEF
jgi:hypothetical protein